MSVLPGVTRWGRRRGSDFAPGEEPLRAELLSVDQLERLAQALADEHKPILGHAPDRLRPRLAKNEIVLNYTYNIINKTIAAEQTVAPAAEWLLDNFYLIEEQIRLIRRHLPRGYSAQLPRLAAGVWRGYPRVYGIALALISHLDGRVDAEALGRFLAAYQRRSVLALGELWAVPIMLRAALVENLRRVAARIATGRRDRNRANEWADRLLIAAEKSPNEVIITLAGIVRAKPIFSPAFVTELVRRLQGQSAALALVLDWLQQMLVRSSENLDRMLQKESQKQAADHVSIGNCIGSLRFIDSLDWGQFVETHSLPDEKLAADPARSYSRMAFRSRDHYRHVIESLARLCGRQELEVAAKALELAAQAARRHGAEDRRSHVGFYLVDQGLRELEEAVGARPGALLGVRRAVRHFALPFYLGSIFLLSLSAGSAMLLGAGPPPQPAWLWWSTALATLLCASSLAMALVNYLCTLTIQPTLLPRMDFSKGVPDECRTLVLIPTILENPAGIGALLLSLEIKYLANRDSNILYGLLTDFSDAAAQVMPEDESLLRQAMEGVEILNRRYGRNEGGPFYLFHRPRRWNPTEKLWMGYERKRGKMTDLIEYLRSEASDKFLAVAGDSAPLPGVQYIITLDADTELPRDSAAEMIGAIAHPLNHPEVDPRTGLVTRGYGILQPRVGANLPAARRSWLVRLFARDAGVDPYTRAVSDVYQDLFGEGSFFGKGILHVDTFYRVLHRRFPDNQILSHDLLEGCHVRSGLASDIILLEDFPWHYGVEMSRRRRWIRGDWQLFPWLFPRVPDVAWHWARNPLSVLSQWKIFDNLRRSLTPPALLLVLLLALVYLPRGGLWILAVAAVLAAAPVLASLVALTRKNVEAPLGSHLRWGLVNLSRHIAQAVLALIFLPYEAFACLDAIGRALGRMCVTRRRLLEWHTSSAAQRAADTTPASFFGAMWPASAIGALTGVAAILGRPAMRIPGELLAAAWFFSPLVAWFVSRSLPEAAVTVDPTQRHFLRMIARRTGGFFEQFMTASENFLPPDNYQEYPRAVTAHRTSPTNMGLALLANLASLDFGWISTGRLLQRTSATLEVMGKLPRHRGHFFNWYDTHSLRALNPLYVSMVDSGNLAGHLLVLRSSLREMPHQPLLSPRLNEGFLDTLLVLADEMARPAGQELDRQLREAIEDLARALGEIYAHRPDTLGDCAARLRQADDHLRKFFAVHAAALSGSLRVWLESLTHQHEDFLEELTILAPWIAQWPPPDVPPNPPPELARLWPELTAHLTALNANPSLETGSETARRAIDCLDRFPGARGETGDGFGLDDSTRTWLVELRSALRQAGERMQTRLRTCEELARTCREFADMDFTFLYDHSRKLFAIGFNVTENRRDTGFYDLLASEARFGSYVAIVLGQVPQDHWFALGRQLTGTAGRLVLLSWGGSLFEYLMPLLVMPSFPDTLLERTCRAVVERNIEYGRQRGIPWGVSESGYNATDAQLNYQYQSFGVPGLGFKRRLSDDVVIAPYAAVLALLIKPADACANLRRLVRDGRLGEYGFYEAVDYTPQRVSEVGRSATIRSFMSHHQGMILLTLAACLLDQPMQRRFNSDPLLRSGELLLQEKLPLLRPVFPHAVEVMQALRPIAQEQLGWRTFETPQTVAPAAHLLSNGHYHLLLTAAGGSRSVCDGLALTRWRSDFTRDCWGLFCYIRDVEAGRYWSNTHQPVRRRGHTYAATFSEGKAEFRRRDGVLDTLTQVVVSPEKDIELRRLLITNRSRSSRRIEITSYAEVVLAPPAADATHPAFSNLFIQTESVADYPALLVSRRGRSKEESPPWLLHLVAVHGPSQAACSWETNRGIFLGRGRSPGRPLAMDRPGPLSNSLGAVLDPIVAVRRDFMIEPEQTVVVDVILGMAPSRPEALGLIEHHHDRRFTDRMLDLAWSHQQVLLRQLNVSDAEAQLFGRLAGPLFYPGVRHRGPARMILQNRRGQSGLWGFGISGDLPIILLRLSDAASVSLVRQMLQAHAYWRLKGVSVDLVLWPEDTSTYRQSLQDQLAALIAASPEAKLLDRPGGIFIRRPDQLSEEDRALLLSAAAIVLSDAAGPLAGQLAIADHAAENTVPHLIPMAQPRDEKPPRLRTSRADLRFFNSIGGLTGDAREYVMNVTAERLAPAPWCNVIANEHFGAVVSESGGMYTWAVNAHEYRLTPWYNDAVSDASGEAIYIRDNQTGYFWSPTPLPAAGKMPCLVRHGLGYSVFERTEQQIRSELWVYVAIDAPVKFCVLKLTNQSDHPRSISATGYWEWVLGERRGQNVMHIVSEMDEKTGALLARNTWNPEFDSLVAFAEISENRRSVTGDRTEFLGRNGSPDSPAAMGRLRLSGELGPVRDPCAAMQCSWELPPGAQQEVVFILGATAGRNQARTLIERYRTPGAARRALEEVWNFWNRLLGTIYLETPDAAANALANGWLPYQTLSSRIWARSGFYQSGGAYGFRDQLQDAMAIALIDPSILRTHLLRAASRQFVEGDVQHWWHPPQGRGVRSRCCDDFLWLPLAVSHYVQLTNDTGVLEESLPFLQGRPLNPQEESYYDLPQRSAQNASLYEHCVRALQYGLNFGALGLPLIGGGDWNDGLNRLGRQGKGQSVWLAFFLRFVLQRFEPLAELRQDAPTVAFCRRVAAELEQAVETHGWDGQWYKRAFFDDGASLGSAQSEQCQIDSLPQSWSVLSQTGDSDRQKTALASVERRLVRYQDRLIQLLDPPFDHPPNDPGYIAGYVPGVRENGGQYTHAAVWVVMAFAQAGQVEKAWELFCLINPLRHGANAADIGVYRVEPYVVAADVYAVPPHAGRGGWTWYTGSAGWMYRLLVETFIGMRRNADRLRFQPAVPQSWGPFRVHYRYFDTFYHIFFTGGGKRVGQVKVDGVVREDSVIPLVNDRREHRVDIDMLVKSLSG